MINMKKTFSHNINNKNLRFHALGRMKYYNISRKQIREALKTTECPLMLEARQEIRYKTSVFDFNRGLTLNIIFTEKGKDKKLEIITAFYTEFPYRIGTGKIWLLWNRTKEDNKEKNIKKRKIKEKEKLKQAIIEHFLKPQVFIPGFIYNFIRKKMNLTIKELLTLLNMKDIKIGYIDNIEKSNTIPSREFERRFKELAIKRLFNKDVNIPIRKIKEYSTSRPIKFEFNENSNNWQIYNSDMQNYSRDRRSRSKHSGKKR